MAARKVATPMPPYKFLTLTSDSGSIDEARYCTDDDTFNTPEDAQANAISRFNDDGEVTRTSAIYIVEVHGVVKPNHAQYTPIGTQSVYDIEGGN